MVSHIMIVKSWSRSNGKVGKTRQYGVKSWTKNRTRTHPDIYFAMFTNDSIHLFDIVSGIGGG